MFHPGFGVGIAFRLAKKSSGGANPLQISHIYVRKTGLAKLAMRKKTLHCFIFSSV